MVKANKNRKGNKRKPRRRIASKRRIMSFPPMIPFNKVFMNIVLRHVVEEDKFDINIFKQSAVSLSSIFGSPWDSLATVFSQVRIFKAVIYVSAGVGYDERGFHAINIAPVNEFEVPDSIQFSTLSSLPGTKLSRIGRMISAEWHPTSSEDRAWYKTDTKGALFDYVYMSHGMSDGGKAKATYPVSWTFDYHVRVRGVNYTKLKYAPPDDVFPASPIATDSIGDCGFETLGIDN